MGGGGCASALPLTLKTIMVVALCQSPPASAVSIATASLRCTNCISCRLKTSLKLAAVSSPATFVYRLFPVITAKSSGGRWYLPVPRPPSARPGRRQDQVEEAGGSERGGRGPELLEALEDLLVREHLRVVRVQRLPPDPAGLTPPPRTRASKPSSLSGGRKKAGESGR
eukprot:767775-Rhodomonas_salina.1